MGLNNTIMEINDYLHIIMEIHYSNYEFKLWNRIYMVIQ